jgi:hypothetical protein
MFERKSKLLGGMFNDTIRELAKLSREASPIMSMKTLLKERIHGKLVSFAKQFISILDLQAKGANVADKFGLQFVDSLENDQIMHSQQNTEG